MQKQMPAQKRMPTQKAEADADADAETPLPVASRSCVVGESTRRHDSSRRKLLVLLA